MNHPPNKRVLICLPNSVYPANAHLRLEALAMIEAGYRVSLICPRKVGTKRAWFEELEGVSVYRYVAPLRRFGVIGYAWMWIHTFLFMTIYSFIVAVRRGFDVIHIYNPPDNLGFLAAFWKLFGKKVVYDHRDLNPEMLHAVFNRDFKPLYRALVWMERVCCQVADTIIAPNESYKKIEMERGGAPEDRIVIVRSGPDLSIVYPTEPLPELRAKGKCILGYVGVMGKHDGLDYLMRALHHLAYEMGRDDFYCVLVGRGKMWQEVQQYARDLKLEPYTWFVGRVEHHEVAQYLSSADICVAPEPYNSYNARSTVIKVNEYMAVGKPVVSFDLPEHRMTAQDAGLYATPNEEADFAAKIAWLMDNPQERAAMGTLALERARTVLSWEYQKEQLMKGYASLWTR